jgi:hypothetical protein
MADGKVREVVETDLVAGAVLRLYQVSGVTAPFSDCVISSIDRDRGMVRMTRPYVYGGLVTAEYFATMSDVNSLNRNFRTVLTDRGRPYRVEG